MMTSSRTRLDGARTWLRGHPAVWIVLGIWVALVVAGFLQSPQAWIDVARTDDVRPITYVPEHRLFVIRTGRAFLALSAVSPHRSEIGERVLLCPAGYFVGPHGELFDRRGLYIGGPSPRGMDRYKVRVTDGVIEVDFNTPLVGPSRQQPGSFPARSVPCPFEEWTETRPGFLAAP
jgi:hypothetical protein